MKKIMLLALACLVLTTQAQSNPINDPLQNLAINLVTGEGDNDTETVELRTYKVKLGNSKGNQVVISMNSSAVEVIGHNSDEVIIQTSNYTPPPQQAEGLKSLYNQVEDNTQLGLGVTKENNILRITKASRQGGSYTIRVPKNVSVVYRESNWNGQNFALADVDGEIEIKLNNGSATLTNVSGPVVANTTNGTLKIKFTALDQNKPSSISSINGNVDITMPASTKANLNLRSINGEIYTDFDLNLKKEDKSGLPRIAGGNTIDGKINGGGVDMSVNTINNNIFIRKSK